MKKKKNWGRSVEVWERTKGKLPEHMKWVERHCKDATLLTFWENCICLNDIRQLKCACYLHTKSNLFIKMILILLLSYLHVFWLSQAFLRCYWLPVTHFFTYPPFVKLLQCFYSAFTVEVYGARVPEDFKVVEVFFCMGELLVMCFWCNSRRWIVSM